MEKTQKKDKRGRPRKDSNNTKPKENINEDIKKIPESTTILPQKPEDIEVVSCPEEDEDLEERNDIPEKSPEPIMPETPLESAPEPKPALYRIIYKNNKSAAILNKIINPGLNILDYDTAKFIQDANKYGSFEIIDVVPTVDPDILSGIKQYIPPVKIEPKPIPPKKQSNDNFNESEYGQQQSGFKDFTARGIFNEPTENKVHGGIKVIENLNKSQIQPVPKDFQDQLDKQVSTVGDINKSAIDKKRMLVNIKLDD